MGAGDNNFSSLAGGVLMWWLPCLGAVSFARLSCSSRAMIFPDQFRAELSNRIQRCAGFCRPCSHCAGVDTRWDHAAPPVRTLTRQKALTVSPRLASCTPIRRPLVMADGGTSRLYLGPYAEAGSRDVFDRSQIRPAAHGSVRRFRPGGRRSRSGPGR
jgi:hypothetical protein